MMPSTWLRVANTGSANGWYMTQKHPGGVYPDLTFTRGRRRVVVCFDKRGGITTAEVPSFANGWVSHLGPRTERKLAAVLSALVATPYRV